MKVQALDEVHALVEESGLPTFVAPMGKGAVNETLPNYCGVYAGSASHPEVVEMVNSSGMMQRQIENEGVGNIADGPQI